MGSVNIFESQLVLELTAVIIADMVATVELLVVVLDEMVDALAKHGGSEALPAKGRSHIEQTEMRFLFALNSKHCKAC